MMKKIAIIGAGPAGLTAAYELSKKNLKVDLYEASQSVGGMAKTISLWGQFVDLGPHRFFSSDPRVNELWLEVIGSEYKMVERITRIFYKKTFFDYPLKPFNALMGLGFGESIICIMSYFYSKIKPIKKVNTFEEWVINRFGNRLFNIFFKSYSEKLWGIRCDELDSEFAAQRIKKLSLTEAIKSALFANRKNKHKTLVDEFAYPLKGSGHVYELMLEKIKEKNNSIFLNTSVRRIIVPNNEISNPIIELSNGNKITYDHVISTMPITKLIEGMDAPKNILNHSKSLKFRNTILVYLEVEGDYLFPDQWIYIHNNELKTGRITNFNNWVETIKNGKTNTILCLEYWCYKEDELWRREDSKLIDLAKIDINKSELIKNKTIKNGKVIRVPNCYPVYKSGYKDHLKPIENYLSTQKGLSVIGRYGSFKYNNQDHSILMGILAAENIIKNTKHNLWEVNSDYEYQESSRITSTGLIK
tara:strand:+ start:796 stop:2217 length:1422 start_codon:yes stop_codon:yes gene_type:complete